MEEILGESLNDFCLTTGRIATLSGKAYFLKTGPESPAYICEAHSLREIAAAKAIRTPKVIAAGENFLLTEFIETGYADTSFFQHLATQLARLHRITSEAYGFYENNYIGANPQPNLPEAKESSDWVLFYFNKRLLFQYKLAESRGFVTSELRSGIHFIEKHIHSILQGSEEPPTLLHGDLWAGNFLCSSQGEPVLIDPAVYYGHREADLAMTRLFGGFAPEFYRTYQQTYPLQPQWEYRENIYKLYHVLNHLNLFGRSYLAEAEYLIRFYRNPTKYPGYN
ncbi:MAG: fructosamine kinase family protein [Bacteroides sp.]|nr:fructosamine kinase family protein [Bacteroides sp.]